MATSSTDSGAASPAPESSSAPRRSRRRAVAVVLGGLLLLAIVVEVVLRLWYSTPSREQIYTDYGWVQAPGSRVISSEEGYSENLINAMGFYDDEVLAEKPPLRAVVLGDSYSQAMQVHRSENFSSVLEQEIPGLEAINTAQAGRDPFHYSAYLGALCETFRPDVVVVQINDGDIGNLRESGYVGLDAEEALARFLEKDPGVVKERGISGPARWIAKRSALATFIYRRVSLLSQSEKVRLKGKFSPPDPDATSDTTGTVDPRIGDLMDGLYAHMTEVTDRIIFLYIPGIIYSSDGWESKFPERRVFYQDFARRNGAVLVDLTEPFGTEFLRTKQPLHGFQNSRLGGGHINAHGHRVAGKLLAQAVRDLTP